MIEILYFEGCPNYPETLALVKRVAAECGLDGEIREISVSNEEEAARFRFLGSPSVRVNGVDIEPEVRGHTSFAVGCRLYETGGVPPKALLVEALRELA